MTKQISKITLTSINNNGDNLSFFSGKEISLQGSPERFLSEQISAENFRLRTSNKNYSPTWHVAGDPTLLIILSGTLRIILRNDETRDFSAGDLFIANDYLKQGVEFDNEQHGHRAEIIGDDELSALHLKLEKRTL